MAASSNYYEKLRTVYEHHLDERIRGKAYNFPSPKYFVEKPLNTLRTFTSSSETLTSPKSEGILKSPKSGY